MFPQLFSAASIVVPSTAAPSSQSSDGFAAILLSWEYGGLPKIAADVVWGIPVQNSAVEPVFDTGSDGFWVAGPENLAFIVSFAYAGNAHIVKTFYTMSGTLGFAQNSYPGLANRRVSYPTRPCSQQETTQLAADTELRGTYSRTALVGTLPPASKYSGSLVTVDPDWFEGNYYVTTPESKTAPLNNIGNTIFIPWNSNL
ncbi:hypothetical protein Daus18300_011320 [Diaporthe australafricana]|uniref:Peptidase A1 domain-containing protein n=1 Tax=Diaporthe australafricana TaxID=127596 RepID=A0ABR3W6Y6_9PEZI